MQGLKLQSLSWLVPLDRLNIVQALVPSCDGGHKRAPLQAKRAHRRAGKTVATINDLIYRTLRDNKSDGRYAFVAPFYNQAKDLAWKYLKQYAPSKYCPWAAFVILFFLGDYHQNPNATGGAFAITQRKTAS